MIVIVTAGCNAGGIEPARRDASPSRDHLHHIGVVPQRGVLVRSVWSTAMTLIALGVVAVLIAGLCALGQV